MPSPKIADKQKAILDASVEVFASRGFWDTPTSLISKTAGIADGTLFTYFKTKDDLIHQVYLELKRELADCLLAGLDEHESVQDKMRHIWNEYVGWGVQNPEKFKVLHQIESSYKLDEQVKAVAHEPFIEVERITDESIA
ncbi:MAG TPA: TetR/AcrR family transcriptional regulator, partial [Phototrophicaceae bacterium]|nr:TetR/AcrR family transcriptional regulator [Phototrophicaceae bacterium]